MRSVSQKDWHKYINKILTKTGNGRLIHSYICASCEWDCYKNNCIKLWKILKNKLVLKVCSYCFCVHRIRDVFPNKCIEKNNDAISNGFKYDF